MHTHKIGRVLVPLVLVAALAVACAKREPFEYRSNLEVPAGPGLLSGKKGGLILFGGE
jgi:hypothetical protein